MSNEVRIQLPKLHPAQTKMITEALRFSVLCCGRRAGKSTLGVELLVNVALSGKPVAWFSPTYKLLSPMWDDISNTLRPLATRVNSTEHRIDLVTGGCVDMWSLDTPDAGRGRKYARVFIDEAAMVKNLMGAWQKAIRPTLADLSGDAWFASTPKGFNDFRTLFNMPTIDKDWRSWRFPTSANPYIKASEIAAMKAELPSRVFEQEVLAEFIEDGSYFRNVNACATVDAPHNPETHKGHNIVMGIDWAGSGEDATVMTLMCKECNSVVDWDVSTQLDYSYQRARVKALSDKWDVATILPERNSLGSPQIEALRDMGLPISIGSDGKYGFNTSATTKPDLIMSLALAIENKTITVPRDYAGELMAYESKLGANNHMTWNAPTGQHDDKVISLALALWAASHATAQVWI